MPDGAQMAAPRIDGAATSKPSRLLFSLPSVDPQTCDLPGPRIEHQARRLARTILQKRKAGMVATVDEELAARQRDDGGGGALLKIKHRQSSACLDLELAILDGELKISLGPGASRSDQRSFGRNARISIMNYQATPIEPSV
jgi:hypothetical protein